tara:strand:+ start:52 stop:903 length:852 start_codon:yes stop_codon:yes gene_type:complete
MLIIKTVDELLEWRSLVESKKSIGFTPTMGALHDGHLSLMEKSINQSDLSCVSIFLNPLQFGKDEDLGSYPQNLDDDIQKIESMGADVVFIPSINDMYKDGDSLLITETNLSNRLEGASRPQFFNGVLTVVAKLFNLIKPDFAYFGMKDAQQLILIQKMVNDLKYPIQIIPCQTIREKSGLAMSSRNGYLNEEQKEQAKILYLSLMAAKKLINGGSNDSIMIKKEMEMMLLSTPNLKIDYISIAHIDTLIEIENKITTNQTILISLAVFLNDVRLIDNIQLTT